MSKIRNEKKGIRLAAGLMAVMMMAAVPFTAAAAEPWDKENGQYVDASGAPMVGTVLGSLTETSNHRGNRSPPIMARLPLPLGFAPAKGPSAPQTARRSHVKSRLFR